jgi:two-component system, OmpR family, response regulator
MRADERPLMVLIGFSSSPAIIGRVRVLVVEDNEAMADAVQRGLRAEGFDVDVTRDGLDGLWRAREFPYDVIVLDILLPGMNGYAICRTLRHDGFTTPILMLTAKDGDDDEAEGLDLGADDFLTKPFSFTVLVARINALIRRTNPTRSSPRIVVGDLVLDTMDMTCTFGGTRIDLTAREYALLEALARRQGQPMTRSELQDLVWGADKASMSNIVDVYVGYVRRKLERAGVPAEVVQTVRGIGYRMVR